LGMITPWELPIFLIVIFMRFTRLSAMY